MRLTTLSTGSKGNAYALQAGGETLLLDAGLPIAQISKAVRFGGLKACVITHEHQDHAKAAVELSRRGIPVIASAGTAAKIGLEGPFYRQIETGEHMTIGAWTIKAFDTQHDAEEPLGFLIRNNTTLEQIVYATDTYYLKYRFPGTHYWLVECNYTDEILDRQTAAGEIEETLKLRLKRSHMSLSRLITALRANNLTETRKIVLVHLSDSRSDEERMKREIKSITGIETEAASDGEIIELNITPF